LGMVVRETHLPDATGRADLPVLSADPVTADRAVLEAVSSVKQLSPIQPGAATHTDPGVVPAEWLAAYARLHVGGADSLAADRTDPSVRPAHRLPAGRAARQVGFQIALGDRAHGAVAPAVVADCSGMFG
jgi:hypothetical protein